jgi:hypothetical protein
VRSVRSPPSARCSFAAAPHMSRTEPPLPNATCDKCRMFAGSAHLSLRISLRRRSKIEIGTLFNPFFPQKYSILSLISNAFNPEIVVDAGLFHHSVLSSSPLIIPASIRCRLEQTVSFPQLAPEKTQPIGSASNFSELSQF